MNFEFEFLSGILPAYPDDDEKENYRVWGYGDPNQDRIRGFDYSIQHIISKMEECGPFSGIVGFSSGGTMAAIITSLLEGNTGNGGPPLEVRTLISAKIWANVYLDSPSTFEIRHLPQWFQAQTSLLRRILPSQYQNTSIPYHRKLGFNDSPSADKKPRPKMYQIVLLRIFWRSRCTASKRVSRIKCCLIEVPRRDIWHL